MFVQRLRREGSYCEIGEHVRMWHLEKPNTRLTADGREHHVVLTGLLLYNNGIYLDCHILNSHCWCSLRRTKTNFTDQAIVIIICFIGARPGIVVVVQIALRRARCAPVIQGASRLSIMHLRTQRYGGYGIGHRYCPVNSTEKYFSMKICQKYRTFTVQ